MGKGTAQVADRSERIRELHEQLVAGVRALTTSEDWARALEQAARFHRYSWRNTILIALQRSDATRVAGYRTWQSLGRQVRRGERGITILAPCKYRVEDDQTGDERWVLRGFRAEHVFDVSQTEGEPLAEVQPDILEGEAPEGLWDALAEQVAAAGFVLERGDCHGANGWADFGSRTVRVRGDVDNAQAVKTLAHELAHVLLHSACSFGERSRGEVEAESVAYVVARAFGLATGGYSFPYVAGWSGGDVERVLETAERVQQVARRIIEGVAA